MINSGCVVVILALLSGGVFAAASVDVPSNRTDNVSVQKKLRDSRGGPVVGSMLEDGREVPKRFRGIETKEQKARREQQEQKQSSSEKD